MNRRLQLFFLLSSFFSLSAHAAEAPYFIDIKRGTPPLATLILDQSRYEAKADTEKKMIPFSFSVRFDGKENTLFWKTDTTPEGAPVNKKTTITLTLSRSESFISFFEKQEDGEEKILETLTVSFPKIAEFAEQHQIPIEEKTRFGIGVFGLSLQYRISSLSASLFDSSRVSLASFSHLQFGLQYSRSFLNEILWPYIDFSFALPNRQAPSLFSLQNDAGFLLIPAIGARLKISEGLFLVANFGLRQLEYIEALGAASIHLVSLFSLAPGAGLQYLTPWTVGPAQFGGRIDFQTLLPIQNSPGGAELSTSFGIDICLYSQIRIKERYLLKPGIGYQTIRVASNQATQDSSALYINLGIDFDFN